MALVPPGEDEAWNNAALLCDSLHPRPYSLNVDEVQALFFNVGIAQVEARLADAGEHSIFVVADVPGRYP